MFDIFNLFFLAATLASNITLYSDGEYMFPKERDSVVAVSTYREWWRADGKDMCRYTGLMVPFVRDWEEVIKQGDSSLETVLPPEPDKTAGHAIIINRKVCGNTMEPIFRVGTIYGAYGGYRKQNTVIALNLAELRTDERPKWLGQVLSRIERLSSTDTAAREFIEFNKKDSLKLPQDLEAMVKRLGDAPAN